MATALTTTELQTYIQKSAFGSMEDMSPDDFLSYLNQVLLDEYELMVFYAESVYTVKATISTTSGYTAPLPTDYYSQQEPELFFNENVEVAGTEVPDSLFRVIGDEIHFTNEQNSSTYYLRYTKEPNEYEAGDTVLETKSVRAKNVILNAVKAKYFDAVNEEAPTDAADNTKAKLVRSQ